MTTEQNKEVIRRWQEAYNHGGLDVLDEVLSPDWVSNSWPGGLPHTIEDAKGFHRQILSLWPDWRAATEELIAEGDFVVQRFTSSGTHQVTDFAGLPPNGKRFSFGGINIFRLRDGKIVEQWTFIGELEFLQQLGAELPEAWVASAGHINRIGPAVDAVAN